MRNHPRNNLNLVNANNPKLNGSNSYIILVLSFFFKRYFVYITVKILDVYRERLNFHTHLNNLNSKFTKRKEFKNIPMVKYLIIPCFIYVCTIPFSIYPLLCFIIFCKINYYQWSKTFQMSFIYFVFLLHKFYLVVPPFFS